MAIEKIISTPTPIQLADKVNETAIELNQIRTGVNIWPAAQISTAAADYTTGRFRNIFLSTTAPAASDGQDGDIWILYEV